jgi:NADH:quinone reductase (non-electrogenic)
MLAPVPPHDASAPGQTLGAPTPGAATASRSNGASARPGGTPRVLVVGGGFGGMMATRLLAHADVEVTLLDRNTSTVFAPLLYQCASGILSEGAITRPLREVFARDRNVTVLLGEATGIDVNARRLTATRPTGSTFELDYDYLILAAGMRQSYFGHDEFAEWAPGMKTISDALEVRRRVYGAFELAETSPPDERTGWLTFAVVGAGPTGVELAGQIRELATRTIAREFRHIDPADARVMLFDGLDRPLTSFGRHLSERASEELRRLGIDLHMNTRVTDVDSSGLVALYPGGAEVRHNARTVLWTAGVEAVEFVGVLAAAAGASQDREGRIKVNDDLTVGTHDEIYAIGDVISLRNLPGVAELALQGGIHAARQIRRRAAGEADARAPFTYRDLGTAAYISRFRALVEIGPLRFWGLIGWLMWGVIHLTMLSGVPNRLAAVIGWLAQIARDKRSERAITTATDATPTTQREAR